MALAVLATPANARAATPSDSLSRVYTGSTLAPSNVSTSPSGGVWFTTDRGLGTVTPAGGISWVPLDPAAPGDIAGMAFDAGGDLWLTDPANHRIWRRDHNGTMTSFAVSARRVPWPSALTRGTDGNMWFVYQHGLAEITPSGTVIRHPIRREGVDAVTAGPDGAMWFVWRHGVGRMTPAGTTTTWTTTTGDAYSGSIAAGPDGNLWVAGLDYLHLLRITPTGTITKIRAGVLTTHVIAGPDGQVWFDDYYGVGRVATDGSAPTVWNESFGKYTDCDPYMSTGPQGGLAFDASGTLWAAATFVPAIERLDQAGTTTSPSALQPLIPRRGAFTAPYAITHGADGTVWVSGSGAIIRFATDGAMTTFRVGVGPAPGDMWAAPDGSIWFTEGASIRHLEADGRVRVYRHGFPKGAALTHIVGDASGTIWFVDWGTGAVGRLTPAGHVTEFSSELRPSSLPYGISSNGRFVWLADASGSVIRISHSGRMRRFTRGLGTDADPFDIATGPDGATWFTEFYGQRIGRITDRGQITEYTVASNPAAITAGRDGALWFTSASSGPFGGAGIGRVTANGRVAEFDVHQTCIGETRQITAGPDGQLWFLEPTGPVAVGRIDPARLIATGALPSP